MATPPSVTSAATRGRRVVIAPHHTDLRVCARCSRQSITAAHARGRLSDPALACLYVTCPPRHSAVPHSADRMVVRLVAVAVVQQPVDVPISETERDEIPDRPHH